MVASGISSNTEATNTPAGGAVHLTLTDSEEIFIKSSGPGVPTSIIISFN